MPGSRWDGTVIMPESSEVSASRCGACIILASNRLRSRGYMARRGNGKRPAWQIFLPLAALAAGIVLLVLALHRPETAPHLAASAPVSPPKPAVLGPPI